MAKMFYTLEEAAEKLGVAADKVKQMASSGKLQQFRDRDKLMFKRDQIDNLVAKGASGSGAPIKGGDIDRVNLAGDSRAATRKEDPRQATGISVFDADEIEQADPMAQTQITQPPIADDDELALESVGSGSGLLDLTRESDDTSLGVELDEIYPSGEASDAKLGGSGVPAGSGLGIAMSGEASGLENLQASSSPSTGGAVVPVSYVAGEPDDPAGSGLGLGLLLGATVALVVLLIVAFGAINGVPTALVNTMAATSNAVMMWFGGLLVLTLIFGLVGFMVGKAKA